MEKLLLLFCLISIDQFEIDQEITQTPEFLERIRRLKDDPIDINTAREIELMLIPYIDKYLAKKIIKYREEHPFKKENELLLIEGITPYLFDRIKKFVTVETKRRKRRKIKGIDYLSRLETKFEDETDEVEDKAYNRIIVPLKNLEISGICEKDYDENNYLDYYAFSIYIPEKIVIGDYDLDLGMGIILGKPDFFYRSAGIIPGERGFSPHRSTYEENFFRGIAYGWNNLMVFGSYTDTRNWGKEKLLGTSYRFSSIRLTGALSETEENGKFGFWSFYADKSLAGNLFRFELASGGENLTGNKNNLSYSMGIDNGKGLKAIYVNIKDSLPTLRNSPFYKDEEAFYLSYTKKISPDLSLGLFTELSRKISPMESFDRIAEIHLGWKPLKNLQLKNRIKTKKGQINGRFDIIHKVKDITFKSRFEVLNGSEGSGFMAFTSFRYSSDYLFEGRLAFYETENWESRIFAHENDLPGKFTIKQLYGSGKRLYIILGEKFLPLKVHFKWGIDFKDSAKNQVGVALGL
jgi:hypothetical protein